MSGLLIFLIILNVYVAAVWLAARWGVLAKYNIGLLGPALMLRTTRGKVLIDRIAQTKRFWIHSGTVGVWLTLLIMLALTALLVIQVPTLFDIPVEQAPGARDILAIPGINPLIPIGYGILALVVAIVIHEFAHGILARAQDLKVKSLGLLYLIVPIGAFVEPDEEELKAHPRRGRMRVYAAGPTSNIVTALICGLVFSAGFVAAADPVSDGVGIVAIVEDSPAQAAGMQPGWMITQIDGQRIGGYQDFLEVMDDTDPGQEVVVQTARNGAFSVCLSHRTYFDADGPDPAEIDPCTLSDGTVRRVLEAEGAEASEMSPENITGFLGMSSLPLGPAALQGALAHPFSDLRSFVFYIAMPFTGLTPMKSPVTDFYDVPWDGASVLGVPGIGADVAADAYWIMANIFYWVMWISLMLGLTNALPAVPLDGGYLFRDFMDGILKRFRPNSTEADRAPLVKRTSVYVSFGILGLILLQFIAPRVAHLFV